MKQEFHHSAYQGMDKDTDVRNMNTANGFHPEARNIHMEPLKSPASMDGTVELDPGLPAGINTPIGSYWDRREDTRVDFWHNSNGNHTIVRHMVKENRFDVVVQAPVLNFDKDHLITGIGLVDNQFLHWTDDLNPPRMVDLDRAQEFPDKKSEVRVFIPSHIPAQIRTFDVSVIDPSGNVVTTFTGLYTASSVDISKYTQMLKNFELAWNAEPSLRQYFEVHACNDYLEFNGENIGRWTVDVVYTDRVASVIQPPATAYKEFRNYYNSPWEREQLDFGAFVPYSEPVATIESDNTDATNSIEKRVIRFAYSYIFRDRGYSTMSPYSRPIYSDKSCSVSINKNLAIIDLSVDTNLDKEFCRGEVDFIELYYQEGTENGWPRDWKSAGRIPKDKWIYTRKIEFDNNTVPVAVDVAYSDLFSFATPHAAKASTQITDQDSNNRILLANTIEDHDTPCLNVDLELDIEEQDAIIRYVDLEVHLRVCGMLVYPNVVGIGIPNRDKYYANQPIWQNDVDGPYRIGGVGNLDVDGNDCDQTTATGGFPVYIAGQSLLGITEQVVTYRTNTATQFVNNTTVLDGTNNGTAINIQQRSGRAGIRACIEQGEIYQKAIIRNVPTGQTVIIRVASPKCGFLDDGSILDLNNPSLQFQRTSTNIFGINDVNATYVRNTDIANREMVVTIPTNATGTLFLGEFLYADNTVPEEFAIQSCPVDIYLFDDNGDDYVDPTNDIRNTGYPMTRTYVGATTYESITNIPLPVTAATGLVYPNAQLNLIAGFASNRCKGADYWSSLGYTFLDQIYREFRNVTDHNGFTWIPIRRWRYPSGLAPGVGLPFQWRLAAVSVGGNAILGGGGTVNGNATNLNYTLSNISVTNLTIVNNLDQNKWVGSLDTPVLTGPEVFIDTIGNRHRHLIAGNVNQDSNPRDKISTQVQGRVVDTNGDAVRNFTVLTTWGPWTTTDQNGDYTIVLHGSMNKNYIIGNNDNDRTEDRTIFNWGGLCRFSFVSGSSYGFLMNIYQYWEGRTYSFNVPYINPDIVINFLSYDSGPYFKRWGVYDIGIIGIDQHGNQTPVQMLKGFKIPGINDDLHLYDPVKYPVPGTYRRGRATINWTINSSVPVPEYNRFRYFQFVATPEQSTDRFLQWAIGSVLYVSRFDGSSGTPVISGYGAQAREIYLDFGDSFNRFREINAGSATVSTGNELLQFGQVGWAYQPGDRIRIITNARGEYLNTPIDVELIGQRGVYLVIENNTTIPQLFGNEVVELYRPGKLVGEAKVYNEIIGAIADIKKPFEEPVWVNSTGTLIGADAWLIPSQIPVRPGYQDEIATPNVPWSLRLWARSSMSVSDYWPSKVPALGRGAVEDPQAKQMRRGTIIRISNSYLPGTSRNGLRLFEPLNNKVANTDYGLIMHMEEMDQVIVCPCSGSRTFAVYLSRELVNSGDTDLITIGSKILGTLRPMAWRFGTVNPESIVRGDTYMFWVDALAGAVVRYDVNGVKSISRRGIGNWFADYCREIVEFSNYKFYGGYNAEFSEYMVTVKPLSKIVNDIDIEAGGDTLTYWFAASDESESGNRWSCFMDWLPEYYGRSAGRMFSMKNGAVYLHDADPDNQNVIYGNKFPMSVDMLFNDNPVTKKVFLSVQANNGTGWYSPEIVTPEGQRSSLIEADYVDDEGVAKAGLLRDINTPVQLPLINGDPLRSSSLTVRFSNNADDGKAILNSAGVHYRTSPET